MINELPRPSFAKPRVGRGEAAAAGILGTILGVISISGYVYGYNLVTRGSFVDGFLANCATGLACLILGFFFAVLVLRARHPGDSKVIKIHRSTRPILVTILITAVSSGFWLSLIQLLSDTQGWELIIASIGGLILIGLPTCSAIFLSQMSDQSFGKMFLWSMGYWLAVAPIVSIAAALSVLMIGFILTPIALAASIFSYGRMLENALGLTFMEPIDLDVAATQIFE